MTLSPKVNNPKSPSAKKDPLSGPPGQENVPEGTLIGQDGNPIDFTKVDPATINFSKPKLTPVTKGENGINFPNGASDDPNQKHLVTMNGKTMWKTKSEIEELLEITERERERKKAKYFWSCVILAFSCSLLFATIVLTILHIYSMISTSFNPKATMNLIQPFAWFVELFRSVDNNGKSLGSSTIAIEEIIME